MGKQRHTNIGIVVKNIVGLVVVAAKKLLFLVFSVWDAQEILMSVSESEDFWRRMMSFFLDYGAPVFGIAIIVWANSGFIKRRLLRKNKVIGRKVDQKEMERRRQQYNSWLEMLQRIDRRRLRLKSGIVIDDEVDYVKRQPEYHTLRPYLGIEPSLRVIEATPTGTESAWMSWLRRSIDDLASQLGLIADHEKTDRKELK